jgi:hypothetical protein
LPLANVGGIGLLQKTIIPSDYWRTGVCRIERGGEAGGPNRVK